MDWWTKGFEGFLFVLATRKDPPKAGIKKTEESMITKLYWLIDKQRNNVNRVGSGWRESSVVQPGFSHPLVGGPTIWKRRKHDLTIVLQILLSSGLGSRTLSTDVIQQYIFFAGYSMLATPLLMSPIYHFWGMSEFELKSDTVASERANNLATHPPI